MTKMEKRIESINTGIELSEFAFKKIQSYIQRDLRRTLGQYDKQDFEGFGLLAERIAKESNTLLLIATVLKGL